MYIYIYIYRYQYTYVTTEFILPSHVSPLNPLAQWHVNLSFALVHVAPFLQGELWQGPDEEMNVKGFNWSGK